MPVYPHVLKALGLVSAVIGLLVALPGVAAGKAIKPPALYADLDGKPIELAEVGQHYCHDFDSPAIHCFSDPDALEQSGEMRAAAGTGVFVTVYEYTLFQGAYMHMSQNYTVLATIGWSDRISSLVVKNSQSGNFYTDWFYGGTVYGFCCNSQLTGLGAFDNTFSSVYRF